MLFTDEAFDEIFKAYNRDEKLVITGCNGMGIEFETSGRLATVMGSEVPETESVPDMAYAAILDNCLFLDCGVLKGNELRSEYCAPFFNTVEFCGLNTLVIKDIKLKKSGKVVFKNPDYKEYFDLARENLIGYGKAYLSSGLTPAVMDSVCQKLNSHIGQAINIYGRTGILYFADTTANGDIIIDYSDFGECKTTSIPKNSNITISRGLVKVSEPIQKETFIDYLIKKGRNY